MRVLRHLVTIPGIVHTTTGEGQVFHCATRCFKCDKLSDHQLAQPGANSDHLLAVGPEADGGEGVAGPGPGTPPGSGNQGSPGSTSGAHADWAVTEEDGAGIASEDVAAFADDSLPLSDNAPSASDANRTADSTNPATAKPAWDDGNDSPTQRPHKPDQHTCTGTGKLKNTTEAASGYAAGMLFLHFSPTKCWNDVVVRATNKKDPGSGLDLTELILFIAIRLFMSCTDVGNARKWWSQEPSNASGAPCRLGFLMSGRRFTRMTAALSFTVLVNTGNHDPFFSQKQMQDAWNQNMVNAWDRVG